MYTDHKPLVGVISNNTDRSPRQSRHLSYISEFTTDFRHLPGVDNKVADALSRLDIADAPDDLAGPPGGAPVVAAALTSPVSLDWRALAAAQLLEKQDMTSASSLQLQLLPFRGLHLWCDVGTGTPRPWIPSSFRRKIFSLLHDIYHPGARTTIRDVSARYVWPGMRSDLRDWSRQCSSCQRSKISRHVHSPLHRRPPPDRRFGSLHVDLVGPLPESRGHRYLFTVIDRYTRWMEAIPLQTMTAEDCGRALVSGWISRYGVPSDLVSDQGRQFVSSLWRHLMTTLGISSSSTTAYHPQANGMVERFHRTLKERLMARQAGPDWLDHLPAVVMGLRASIREDSLTSPAELVFGAPFRLPGAIFDQDSTSPVDLDEFVGTLRSSLASLLPHPVEFHRHDSGSLPGRLHTARAVFLRVDSVRRPLEPPYEGPFVVIQRGLKTFTIRRGSKDVVVSVDRLKPAVPFPGTAVLPPSPPSTPVPAAPVSSRRPVVLPPALKTPYTTRSGRVSRPTVRFQ